MATAMLWAVIPGQAATIAGTVSMLGLPGDAPTPVRNASVLAFRTDGDGVQDTSRDARLDSALTDARGAYSINGLDTGEVILEARMHGYRFGNPRYLVSLPNDTGRYIVNFLLKDTAVGAITITVTKDSLTGPGVAGAQVILSGGTSRRDTVRTDANGRYTFPGLSPGRYSISVKMTGYSSSFDHPANVDLGVVRFQTTSIRVVLWPPDAKGSLAGKVVRAADGVPVPGAKVLFSHYYHRSDMPDMVILDSTTTGDDGTYAFRGMQVQRERMVMVKAPGFQTATARVGRIAYDETFQAPFLLVPSNPAGTSGGSVAGVVRDTAGKGVAGALAILSPYIFESRQLPRDTVETDADGRFCFPKASVESYFVSVHKEGFYAGEYKVNFADYSHSEFEVADGHTRTIYYTLRAQRSLRGGTASAREALRLRAGISGNLVLEAPAKPVSAQVGVYDIRGAVRFRAALPAGATRLDIPWTKGQVGFVVVRRGRDYHRLAAPLAP
jgi:hypothetical protein